MKVLGCITAGWPRSVWAQRAADPTVSAGISNPGAVVGTTGGAGFGRLIYPGTRSARRRTESSPSRFTAGCRACSSSAASAAWNRGRGSVSGLLRRKLLRLRRAVRTDGGLFAAVSGHRL